ncbi:hypothetical protein Skr01_27170 [Sphaerisporangium krabiense]|uniref:DUF1707 domain-containing protein n=1 Tax=Sphaerisporangium krabiense TaxID=763782 RepID=A0A7W9DUG8_9ACTN|nr:DUF1707 domain-containing protein [Sphaerisporangium krabiense]MBB5630415.1 hypothetical protein [Sphaerisporangium krabiense]GII62632.1 hypothetical protein Skr01_27170 [Sphaerisporangium krabiense]
MTSRDDLRIGDAERDEVMAALREHFAQGRLTHDELTERLDTVLAARTAGDLRRVTADLPGPAPARAEHDRRGPWGPPPPWARWEHQGRPGPHAGPAPWAGPAWTGDLAAHHAMRAARRARARRHHGGPPAFMIILAVALIVSLVSGSLWVMFGVLKVLFLVWLVLALLGVAHRLHHHGRPGRRF